jgi:hypothetical protein
LYSIQGLVNNEPDSASKSALGTFYYRVSWILGKPKGWHKNRHSIQNSNASRSKPARLSLPD